MPTIVWLKARCPFCGELYEYIEGKPIPATCSKYDCVHKHLHPELRGGKPMSERDELLDYIQTKLQSAFTHEGAGILHAGGLAREYAEDFVAKAKQYHEQVNDLAELLEEPRAVRLLAEWLAIDHDETRLQYEKYMTDAQGLYDYITVIIKSCPKQKRLDRPELREALAELEHKQWIKWSQAIADEVSTSRRARWKKLWIPYKDLTEKQKDQDREWADKSLALLIPDIEEAKK